MKTNASRMRGVVDPMALGFLLSLAGTTLVMLFDGNADEHPPVALAQACIEPAASSTDVAGRSTDACDEAGAR